MNEIAAYAPIAGLPAYLEAVKNLTFADNKPDGYLEAVATAGGTGAIHNTIWNYSEIGDSVLTRAISESLTMSYAMKQDANSKHMNYLMKI